jgi:uncharacterized membrane protein
MKKFSLYAIIILYIAAGINHFIHPSFYLKIMPPWLSFHKELVLISGVLELLFGLLLAFSFSRPFAAWGIILLLMAVFPANIQMMINYKNENNPQLWVAILRLPIQLVLIYWAYGFTKKLN